MKFNYDAMDSNGKEVDGVLEASSSEEAISKIRNLGLFPTKIKEIKAHTSVFEGIIENKTSIFDDLDIKGPMTAREKLMSIFICLLLIIMFGLMI